MDQLQVFYTKLKTALPFRTLSDAEQAFVVFFENTFFKPGASAEPLNLVQATSLMNSCS